MVERLLKKQNMTKYRLAVEADIPHATLSDICSGKTRLEKCSAETVYKLAKTLGVSMEMLTVAGIQETERERAYEYGLPEYLQHDLDAYKEGLKNKSDLLDCLWGELYGSINIAEIDDRAITPEHADYLRNKYLFGGENDRDTEVELNEELEKGYADMVAERAKPVHQAFDDIRKDYGL